MRVFRSGWFRRSVTDAAIHPQDAATAGLDAFAPEARPDDPSVNPSPAGRHEIKTRALLVFLAGLAVVEAVPAGLWLNRALVSRAAAISPDGVAPVIPPVIAPCDVVLPAAAKESSIAASPLRQRSKTAASVRQRPSGAAVALPPGSVGGLLSVAAPLPMRVFSSGRLVGTTEAESIMLPVGRHDLQFVNEAAGYRVTRTVTVEPGRPTKLALEVPSGTVHVNAAPWAAVSVDNRAVGETPIGNLKLPVGPREFVFRHPELGERRTTVFVTLKETVRVTVDMRQR